jgi:hypothetical protein
MFLIFALRLLTIIPPVQRQNFLEGEQAGESRPVLCFLSRRIGELSLEMHIIDCNLRALTGLLEFANLHSFERALMLLEAIVPLKAHSEIDY